MACHLPFRGGPGRVRCGERHGDRHAALDLGDAQPIERVGIDIDALGLVRGHRTLTVLRAINDTRA
jgi:hypothetical protein